MKRLRRFGAGLIVLSLLMFLPAWANQDLPAPYIHVKRELGDPEVEVPPIGIVGMDDFSQLYITSPLRRFLGETAEQIKASGTSLKNRGHIKSGKNRIAIFALTDELSSPIYYLFNNQVMGYVLGGYMPIAFHDNEDFLQEMYALGNHCDEYMNGKNLPQSIHFECYKVEHSDYIEEYVIEMRTGTPFFHRALIIDAFYPKVLKSNSQQLINRIIDESIQNVLEN